MANTNMDVLIPELWAMEWDQFDMGQYNLQNQVSRKTESLVASKGDTVHVPLNPDLGDAEDYTPGSSITTQAITQAEAQVVLNKSKNKTITLNDRELSLSAYDLAQKYANPMLKSLVRAVNEDIYNEMLKSPYFVDATGGITPSLVVDAGTMLDNNEVGLNRLLTGSPAVINALMKNDAYKLVNETGDTNAMNDGILVRKDGFDITKNNIISKYTPADLTGAINDAGGATPGDTTIVVDGFNDDANPIKAGDIFTIADETGTPKHTVISTTTTSSDTTGITFYPAIVDGGADDAVITVTPTQSALAFEGSGVAFAARAYATTPEGAGVRSSVFMANGLPVRLSMWTSELVAKIQMDILYGVTLVNSKRVVRLIEDL